MHPDSMPVQPTTDEYDEQIEWFAKLIREANEHMNKGGIPEVRGMLPARVAWLLSRYKTLLKIAHECVGLNELMLMGYTSKEGNDELECIEKEMNAKGWSWADEESKA